MRFDDKVALITGGAQGIGLACARRFASEGASVVIADIDEQRAAQAVEALNAGARARFVVCDVGERAAVDRAVAEAVGTFGRLDICVSNAAIVHGADFLAIEEADFDRVLRVNLKGVFSSGQAAARQMVGQGGGGAIINMSSINAVVAIPDQIPYVVAKGGIAQLTKAMALSLAPHGIRVNAIGPGSILTEMLKTVVLSNDAARQKILARTPAGRLGEVDEVAAVAAFLASDDASYITGETVYADGGRLALNYTVPVL